MKSRSFGTPAISSSCGGCIRAVPIPTNPAHTLRLVLAGLKEGRLDNHIIPHARNFALPVTSRKPSSETIRAPLAASSQVFLPPQPTPTASPSAPTVLTRWVGSRASDQTFFARALTGHVLSCRCCWLLQGGVRWRAAGFKILCWDRLAKAVFALLGTDCGSSKTMLKCSDCGLTIRGVHAVLSGWGA